MNARSHTDWLIAIRPQLTALRAQLDLDAQDEARAKLRAYKLVTCQAETFDRALALLDLCVGQVDVELAAEITKLLGRMR